MHCVSLTKEVPIMRDFLQLVQDITVFLRNSPKRCAIVKNTAQLPNIQTHIRKILSIHKIQRSTCITLRICRCDLKPLTLMYMEPPVLKNSIQRQGEHTEKWKVEGAKPAFLVFHYKLQSVSALNDLPGQWPMQKSSQHHRINWSWKKLRRRRLEKRSRRNVPVMPVFRGSIRRLKRRRKLENSRNRRNVPVTPAIQGSVLVCTTLTVLVAFLGFFCISVCLFAYRCLVLNICLFQR